MKYREVFMLLALCACTRTMNPPILENSSYEWYPDRIVQGQYTGIAETPYRIVSDYDGDTLVWECRHDLSAMPKLHTPFLLEEAVYNMSVDECINAVEPDSTLRTGLFWGGVWTRDVSYSTLLSMAYMQPRAAMKSLLCKIGANGQIIQDTGTGGAWPCSSDRQVWTVAAWELYKVTGDFEWLSRVYPVAKKSLEVDMKTIYDEASGLVRGESSFIDWREQSYPRWMEPADIYDSKCLGTNIVHFAALQSAAQMADVLGDTDFASVCRLKAGELKDAVNTLLWMPEQKRYVQFLAGRHDDYLYDKSETLGQALAILYGVAEGERAEALSQNMPIVEFGAPVFWPWIADIPPYHNRAVWPFVQSFWMHASAMTGNEEGVLNSIGSLYRAAAMFATNKENFVADSGDWKGTQINSSNMLWSLSGSISIISRVLMGMTYGLDGLHFAPFVPAKLEAVRRLEGFRYRGAVLDVTVEGFGDSVKSFSVDGISQDVFMVPADMTGRHEVRIVMSDSFRKKMRVNMQEGVSAPLTPAAVLEADKLVWDAVEGASGYLVFAGGRQVARTADTSVAILPQWQGDCCVAAVSDKGVMSFYSEPVFIGREVRMSFAPVTCTKASGDVFEVQVDVPESGVWGLKWNYANGNGDITTDRKCAVRTLYADDRRVDICVFPQRGVDAWDDWGWTSPVAVQLEKGKHSLRLEFHKENDNMQIDINDFAVRGLLLEK